jgi:SagB-type dehydrogenase family enzyme
MFRADDPQSLSQLYHLNSEPWVNPAAVDAVYEVEYEETGGPELPLPPVEESPLMDVIRARRSCRDFAPRAMRLKDLATLLGGAYGITRRGPIDDRAAPSAGGLYPLEVYTVARAIDGVADGIYHYNVRGHSLEFIRDLCAPGELGHILLGQHFLEQANALILLSAVFARTQRKYGPRGYRYALLEAGHVAHNLCLLAAERGLGSLCVGGFFDRRLNRLLQLDGVEQAIIYAVAIGHRLE